MKKYFRNLKPDEIMEHGIYSLYFILFLLCTVLFFQQSVAVKTADISLRRYNSELLSYLSLAAIGVRYTIVLPVLHMLFQLTNNTIAVALFLGLVSVLTAWFSYRYLKYLLPDTNKYLLQLSGLFLFFVHAIYISPLNGIYLISITANPWVTATFSAVRMVSVPVMLLFFDLYMNYRKSASVPKMILFSVLFMIATATKANFTMAFAPAMFFALLIDFISAKGKERLKPFLFAFTALPAVICSFALYFIVYGQNGVFKGVTHEISFMYTFRYYSKHPYAAIFQSMAFPFIVLAYNIKCLKTDRVYGFSWGVWLIAFLQAIFLIEAGQGHAGNWMWGSYIFTGTIFLNSFSVYYKNIKNRRNIPKKKRSSHNMYLIIAAVLLAAHIASGIYYFLKLRT